MERGAGASMPKQSAGTEIERLIALLARLPGLRDRSACGNIDTGSPCSICRDPRRDQTMIVVVEEIGDLWALERAGVVSGLYHVLGGHLSPLDGIGPEQLAIRRPI